MAPADSGPGGSAVVYELVGGFTAQPPPPRPGVTPRPPAAGGGRPEGTWGHTAGALWGARGWRSSCGAGVPVVGRVAPSAQPWKSWGRDGDKLGTVPKADSLPPGHRGPCTCVCTRVSLRLSVLHCPLSPSLVPSHFSMVTVPILHL